MALGRRDFIKLAGLLGISALLPKGLRMASFSELMMKVVDGQPLSPLEREQMRQYTNEMDTNNKLVSSWQQVNKKIKDIYLDLPIVQIYSNTLSDPNPSLTILIPSDYRHLIIFSSVITDGNVGGDFVHGRFNDDSGNNYMDGYIGEYNGSTTGQIGETLTRDDFGIASSSDSAFDSGAAGSSVIFIPHYNSGVWKTQLKIQGVGDSSGTALLTSFSIWKSTSPIRKLTIFPNTASNLAAGSAFTILGIK